MAEARTGTYFNERYHRVEIWFAGELLQWMTYALYVLYCQEQGRPVPEFARKKSQAHD